VSVSPANITTWHFRLANHFSPVGAFQNKAPLTVSFAARITHPVLSYAQGSRL
jgi:hypothetical protein